MPELPSEVVEARSADMFVAEVEILYNSDN